MSLRLTRVPGFPSYCMQIPEVTFFHIRVLMGAHVLMVALDWKDGSHVTALAHPKSVLVLEYTIKTGVRSTDLIPSSEPLMAKLN